MKTEDEIMAEVYEAWTPLNPAFKEMSGEEAQAYVVRRFPHAYVHIHGPESTIIYCEYSKRKALEAEGKQVEKPMWSPAALGKSILIDPRKLSPTDVKRREDYLWKTTAHTVWFYMPKEAL